MGPFWQNNKRWVIFGIMTAAILLSYFNQVGLATVSGSVAASLQINASQLGLLGAAFSWAYAFMQIPAGLLVDSLGSRKSASVFLLVAAVGTFIFARSASLHMAIFGRALAGVGIALIAVPLMKLTAVWFKPREFGKITALSFTIGGAGYWLATTPMAFANAAFGWRSCFFALGILTCLFSFLIWIIVRDKPDDQKNANASLSSLNLLTLLKTINGNLNLWILGMWYFFQGGLYFSFIGLWGGQYLERVLRMNPEKAGWLLSLAACSLMLAPCFTWLADRVGGNRRALLILSICSSVFTAPLLSGLEGASSFVISVLFLALSVSAIGGAAVLFSASVEQLPSDYAGTITGFINMFPYLGGAIFCSALVFS